MDPVDLVKSSEHLQFLSTCSSCIALRHQLGGYLAPPLQAGSMCSKLDMCEAKFLVQREPGLEQVNAMVTKPSVGVRFMPVMGC